MPMHAYYNKNERSRGVLFLDHSNSRCVSYLDAFELFRFVV